MNGLSWKTQAVAQIMRDGARDILFHYFGRMTASQQENQPKGGWKTDADEDNETYLTTMLGGTPDPSLHRQRTAHLIPKQCKGLYPGVAVVGEETVKATPDTLAGLTASHVFTVDGLDGTANFVKAGNGFAANPETFEMGRDKGFGSIIGESMDGRVQRAWVLEATRAHGAWQSRILFAERGKGVWVSEQEGEPFTRLPPVSSDNLRLIDGKRVIALDPAAFAAGILKFDSLAELNAQKSNKFHYTSEYWSAVSIYSGMARGEIAGIVHGPTLAWDKPFAALAIPLRGGKLMTLNDGSPFQFGRMAGGIVAGITPEICDTSRAETCRPIEETREIEPCNARYFTANPYFREPITIGRSSPAALAKVCL